MLADFMTEVRDVYAPFFKLVDDGTVPECEAVDFVRTRYRIILNYCTNISFCLMLRVKGIRVKGHPVVNRLAQYNELLNKIDECKQEDLLKQVADIVRAAKENKPLYSLSDGSELQYTKKKKKKEKSTLNSLSKNLAHQKKMKNQEKYEFDRTEEIDDKDDIETMNDEDYAVLDEREDNKEEGKRAITYEMAKNKGLTPYRKKEQRNPRVKYRNKYHKALIRRKGAVSVKQKKLNVSHIALIYEKFCYIFENLFTGKDSEKGADSLSRRNLGYQSGSDKKHKIHLITKTIVILYKLYKCNMKQITR